MDRFKDFLNRLPASDTVLAIKDLYEAVYLPNGQPERVEKTEYAEFTFSMMIRRDHDLNDILGIVNDLDSKSGRELDQFAQKHDYALATDEDTYSREDALVFLNRTDDITGLRNAEIVARSDTMRAWNVGDYQVIAKIIKPYAYAGETQHTDPEWNMHPEDRDHNRLGRWLDDISGKPYADEYRADRAETPEDFNDYKRYAQSADLLNRAFTGKSKIKAWREKNARRGFVEPDIFAD